MNAAAPRLVFAAAFATLAACAAPGGVDLTAEQGAEAPASIEIGSRLLAARQPEMALDAFTRVISEQGVSAEALNGVGASYYMMGRPGQARRFFEAAIKEDPDDAAARNNLGVALLNAGEYHDALDELEKAYAITSGADPKIAANLGMAQVAVAERAPPVMVDEADWDVIQYGQGVYRLEPRRPDPSEAPKKAPAQPEAQS